MPAFTTEFELCAYFNSQMINENLCTLKNYPSTNTDSKYSKNPIIECRLSKDKPFGFIDFFNDDDCTNCFLNFDGITYKNNVLKIRRPEKYDGPHGNADVKPEIIEKADSRSTRINDRYIGETKHKDKLGVKDHTAHVSDRTSHRDRDRDRSTDRSYNDGRASHLDSPGLVSNLDVSAYANLSSKISRELFVGNITEEMSEEMLRSFLGGVLIGFGLSNLSSDVYSIHGLNNSVSFHQLVPTLSNFVNLDKNPVIAVKHHGTYGFVEFRTPEDASNMMNFGGLPFMGSFLKMSRPGKFDG